MTCTGHCEASYAAAAMQEEEKLRRLRAAKESPFPMPGGAFFFAGPFNNLAKKNFFGRRNNERPRGERSCGG